MKDIPNLENLISSHLENGEKIVDVDTTALTAPGENYGSIMLRIDIKLKNENTGKERTLNTVGKFIPENEKIQEVFHTQLTYTNEYNYYEIVVPTLDKFLKTKGISSGADFAAPFYGGRINLDGSDIVNSDAVILMGNLKSAGYTTGNKAEGLDFETSKIVLNSLAKLHAAGIALKHYEPQTFEKKLKPHFFSYIPNDHMFSRSLEITADKLAGQGFTPEEINTILSFKTEDTGKANVNDTWGTITHYDSWTNNFLLKYENNKPVHAILVDFQVYDYASPLDDVMFFLFTSIQQDIFKESLDPLLDYYYQTLLDYLKKLEINTEPFTKSSFEEEAKWATKNYEYVHAMWMLFPIMHEAMKSVETSVDELSDWSEEHLRKVVEVTRVCFEKGWLSGQKLKS